MQECPECGIVLPEDLWAVGESCPVCNPEEEPSEYYEHAPREEVLLESDGFSDDSIWGYKNDDPENIDEDLKLCPECDYQLNSKGKCPVCSEGARYANSYFWGD